MGPSSSPPHSHHKQSSTMLDHSPPLPHASIEYLRGPLRVLRTRYSGLPGAKTMVDNASPLEVPTGRLLSGMLRVRRSSTRFDFTYSRLVKSYLPLSCPAIRVRSPASTSTPRNQLVSQLYRAINPFPLTPWFVSSHRREGRYLACWRTRTRDLCLKNVPHLRPTSFRGD